LGWHISRSGRWSKVVHLLPQVGGEDGDAAVFIHLLQEIADLDVGVTVMRILNLGALAEQPVRLVEEQNRMAGSPAANSVEIFSVSPICLLTMGERSIL
jgi:hypothetical protein